MQHLALAPSGEVRDKDEKGPKSRVMTFLPAGRCLPCFLVPQDDTRRLEFAMWLVAWDRYAIGAQVVEHQMEFKQSLLHKEVVISVACSASAGGRSDLLGVLYDELARSVFWFLSAPVCLHSCQEEMRGPFGKAREKL